MFAQTNCKTEYEQICHQQLKTEFLCEKWAQTMCVVHFLWSGLVWLAGILAFSGWTLADQNWIYKPKMHDSRSPPFPLSHACLRLLRLLWRRPSHSNNKTAKNEIEQLKPPELSLRRQKSLGSFPDFHAAIRFISHLPFCGSSIFSIFSLFRGER